MAVKQMPGAMILVHMPSVNTALRTTICLWCNLQMIEGHQDELEAADALDAAAEAAAAAHVAAAEVAAGGSEEEDVDRVLLSARVAMPSGAAGSDEQDTAEKARQGVDSITNTLGQQMRFRYDISREEYELDDVDGNEGLYSRSARISTIDEGDEEGGGEEGGGGAGDDIEMEAEEAGGGAQASLVGGRVNDEAVWEEKPREEWWDPANWNEDGEAAEAMVED